MNFFQKMLFNIKESARKFIVSLKRRPQNIAFFFFIIAFLFYSFNQTVISDTTARLLGNNMGLCSFITFLLSILAFVCFLNSFPKRQKPKIMFLVLFAIMTLAVLLSDIGYLSNILHAIATDPEIQTDPKVAFILKAKTVVIVHIVLEVISSILLALTPIFGKLLRKINTSVDVASNKEMHAIEIESEA